MTNLNRNHFSIPFTLPGVSFRTDYIKGIVTEHREATLASLNVNELPLAQEQELLRQVLFSQNWVDYAGIQARDVTGKMFTVCASLGERPEWNARFQQRIFPSGVNYYQEKAVGVVTDLDKTLLKSGENELSEPVLKALCLALRTIPVCIATGRISITLDRLVRQPLNAYIEKNSEELGNLDFNEAHLENLSFSGGQGRWFSHFNTPDKHIYFHPIFNEREEEFQSFINFNRDTFFGRLISEYYDAVSYPTLQSVSEANHPFHVITEGGFYFIDKKFPGQRINSDSPFSDALRQAGLSEFIGNFENLASAFSEDNQLKSLGLKFLSDGNSLDVVDCKAGKGASLRQFMETFDISEHYSHRILRMGDGQNDQEMVNLFPHGGIIVKKDAVLTNTEILRVATRCDFTNIDLRQTYFV
jgi:hydroxymethylpyrimidine pyrophosphatase-like HAD family hydrolase